MLIHTIFVVTWLLTRSSSLVTAGRGIVPLTPVFCGALFLRVPGARRGPVAPCGGGGGGRRRRFLLAGVVVGVVCLWGCACDGGGNGGSSSSSFCGSRTCVSLPQSTAQSPSPPPCAIAGLSESSTGQPASPNPLSPLHLCDLCEPSTIHRADPCVLQRRDAPCESSTGPYGPPPPASGVCQLVKCLLRRLPASCYPKQQLPATRPVAPVRRLPAAGLVRPLPPHGQAASAGYGPPPPPQAAPASCSHGFCGVCQIHGTPSSVCQLPDRLPLASPAARFVPTTVRSEGTVSAASASCLLPQAASASCPPGCPPQAVPASCSHVSSSVCQLHVWVCVCVCCKPRNPRCNYLVHPAAHGAGLLG